MMNTVWSHLYQVCRMDKFTEIKQKESLGEGAEGLLFRGYRVPVWEGEKVLKKQSGDGCTLTPLSHTPKDGYNDKLYIM